MELRNISTFLTVAEMGSYTRAAESLGYVQSTISSQIQQLEEEMGVKLFNQIGRKMYLSSEGEQLVELSQEMMKLKDQILDLGNTQERELMGTLRFGCVESILYAFVLPVIGRYHSMNPKVSITLYPSVSRRLIEHIYRDEIDLAFTMGNSPYTRDCRILCSHKEEIMFIASKEHPLASRGQLTFKEVLEHPIINIGAQTFVQNALYNTAADRGLKIQSYLQSESAVVVLSLVSQNLGIALLPAYLLDTRPFAGHGLVALPVSDFSMMFNVHVFCHKNKWITPEMSTMIHLIQENWDRRDAGM